MASSSAHGQRSEVERAVAASSLDFSDLEGRLKELTPLQQRCARCLLGLAIGDCVGLPFELFSHRENRRLADRAATTRGMEGLQHCVLMLMLERLGRFGPLNEYSRPYSDDTVVTDSKISAIVQFSLLRTVEESSAEKDLLWQCFLSQLLAWQSGSHGGKLFQGFGGFTKGLLRPSDWREEDKSSFRAFKVQGLASETWPTEVYAEWARQYCLGDREGEDGSWGNGTVMSLAPPVLANHLCRAQISQGPQGGSASAAPAVPSERDFLDGSLMNVFLGLHTHQHARQAADLMQAIISATLSGEVASTADLPKFVRGLAQWTTLLAVADESYSMHPLRLFDAWMASGDCSRDEAAAFLLGLSGAERPPQVEAPQGAYNLNGGNPHNGPVLGQLLRSLANWDDEMGARLTRPSGELVRFSQRGLNSVLIALWAVSGARCCWDWIARLIYVGGDTDTIGAVAGQLAGPLMEASDMHRTFQQFVGFTKLKEQRRYCLEVVTAAARRYYNRVLLFCRLEWSSLAREPSLTYPYYEGLLADPSPSLGPATSSTSNGGSWAQVVARGNGSRSRGKRANRSSSSMRTSTAQTSDRVRVLWLDSAFLRVDRGRRYNEASKARCNQVGEVQLEGWCDIHRETDPDRASAALRALAPHYTGGASTVPMPRAVLEKAVAPFDVVVVEQDFKGDDSFGTSFYLKLCEEWKAATSSPTLGLTRPQVILLTARYDKQLAEFARNESYAGSLKKPLILQRFDDTWAIMQAIYAAPCLPALPQFSAPSSLSPPSSSSAARADSSAATAAGARAGAGAAAVNGAASPSPTPPPMSRQPQPMIASQPPPVHRGDRATSMEVDDP